jgi:TatD DNase family protein
MFIDTHAHIYTSEFAEDLDKVIMAAKEAKISRIYMPNIDQESISEVKKLAELYPDICKPLMGLHPCYVKEDYKTQLKVIKQELFNNDYLGVGEIGLDFYWDKSFTEQQIEAFRLQINWASELKLPIIIHSRESLDMTISIVTELQKGNLTGIFHCFTGTLAQAKKIQDLGFKMGIGGVLTFKNSGLDKIVKNIELEHLVLETDAPYLSPTPFRGKRNESSYITLIAQKLADITVKSIEEIGKITTQNADSIYQHTPL